MQHQGDLGGEVRRVRLLGPHRQLHELRCQVQVCLKGHNWNKKIWIRKHFSFDIQLSLEEAQAEMAAKLWVISPFHFSQPLSLSYFTITTFILVKLHVVLQLLDIWWYFISSGRWWNQCHLVWSWVQQVALHLHQGLFFLLKIDNYIIILYFIL